MQLTSIFCFVDDFANGFFKQYRKKFIADKNWKSRVRTDCLSESEIATILIWFNLSGFKCFKHFYYSFYPNLKLYFPRIPCYERCVILQKKAFAFMSILMKFLSKKTSRKADVYYIDSTFMEVCKNQRIYRHKTFKGLAARGKSSCSWFYGFKLHLITNHIGDKSEAIATRSIKK